MIRHVHNALSLLRYLLKQCVFPLAIGAGVTCLLAGRGDLLAALVALVVAGLVAKVLMTVVANALNKRVGGGR